MTDPDLELEGVNFEDLWMAVIRRAKLDMDGHVEKSEDFRRRAGIRAEAAQWFRSESREVGAFLWICGALDVNPALIRERL